MRVRVYVVLVVLALRRSILKPRDSALRVRYAIQCIARVSATSKCIILGILSCMSIRFIAPEQLTECC